MGWRKDYVGVWARAADGEEFRMNGMESGAGGAGGELAHLTVALPLDVIAIPSLQTLRI